MNRHNVIFNLRGHSLHSIQYLFSCTHICTQKDSKLMTFDAFSLNYTYNISIDPLGWYWILKVGPLLTFLSKKWNIFQKIYPNEMRFNLAEKLAQVKTKLTWWTKTISPIFFKFCVIFRFTWK